MASLLKNQILKHLSKFCKNLSPDKISLSTLRGEGELSNLELDEDIITELLDLPTWLKISRAFCNKVSIKIQWTKLKSQPIYLMLDKVQLEAETCDEPRPPNNPAQMASYRSGGKYGFVDRVIDGIFIHVESVEIKLMSKAFQASLQLLRLRVHSTTPNWHATSDLRQTRIRDSDGTEILLFKEVDWQNMKVEASTTDTQLPQDVTSTPLRLLANQAKIRITMKKKLSDCSIISSRIMLLLDDILWVLTATQLKAAILYSNSLKEVIERSSEQSKRLAAVKLQKQGHLRAQSDQQQPQQQQQQQVVQSRGTAASFFTKYDVSTTSHHLISSRIDLHLCDDRPVNTACESDKTYKTEGGSMQITMYRLSLDVYPYHPAGVERKYWHRYTDYVGSRNSWVQQLFSDFREEVMQARKAFNIPSPTSSSNYKPTPQYNNSPLHGPPSPYPSPLASPAKPMPSPTSGARSPLLTGPRSPQVSPSHHRAIPRPRSTRLLESCVVAKLEDFTIYMVSTPENKRTGHPKFFASDKKQLHLPADMSVLHVEYTDYFFPEGLESPVPHSNMYMLVNPVRLTVDYLTLLWSNYFLLSLSQNLNIDEQMSGHKEHVDIKVEALMPRMLIPNESRTDGPSDRPEYLQIQISKLCATNTRVVDKAGRDQLDKILKVYRDEQLLTTSEFPKENSVASIPPHFRAHVEDRDNQYVDKSVKKRLTEWSERDGLVVSGGGHTHDLSTNTLKRDAACDIWCVVLEQLWLEFLVSLSSKARPQPFVEAFPVSLWICRPRQLDATCNSAKCQSKVSNTHVGIDGNAESHHVSSNDKPEREKRPQRLLLKQYYSCDSDDESRARCRDEGHVRCRNEESSSAQDVCDMSKERSTSTAETSSHSVQYSDCHILPYLGAKLRIQMNHFQYVLLMRLGEALGKFQIQMASDFAMLGSTNSSSFCMPLVLPYVEFAVVCPCLINQRCFPDDFASPTSPLGQLAHFSMPGSRKEFPNGQHPRIEFTESDVSPPHIEDSCSNNATSDMTITEAMMISNSMVDSSNMTITKSMSDSTIQAHATGVLCHSESTSDLERKPTTVNGQATGQLQRTAVSALTISVHDDSSAPTPSYGLDSGIGMDGRRSLGVKYVARLPSQKPSDVKKAFSSAFSSFTDKLKLKMDDDALSVGDDMETVSVKTDISSDEEFEHLMFEDSEVPAFCHDPPSETPSTTGSFSDLADDASSVYAESSSTRGKEIISVVLFQLDTTEVLVSSDDQKLTVAAQVSKVSTCQPGNINTEEFQAKFSSQTGFFKDSVAPPSSPRTFPYRVQFCAETADSRKSLITVRSQDCSLSFKMSSLMSLADFIEDEKIPEPVPMLVHVDNLLLILEEDRPSSNPTSPGAVPVDLQIHKLTIRRGADGIFHISGGSIESAPMGLQSLQPLSTLGGDNSSSRLSEISDTPSKEDITPVLHLEQFRQVQNENFDLRQQMRNYQSLLASHEQLQTQLKASMELTEKIQSENELLKMEINTIDVSGKNSSSAPNEYETENLILHQKLTDQVCEMNKMMSERDSLVATLKLLQDDLMASERRHRSHTTVS